MKVETTIHAAEAHPSEGIDDIPPAGKTGQAFVPMGWVVAIHVAQQPIPLIAAQQVFYLAGTAPGSRQIPLRGKTGVAHHHGAGRVFCQQRVLAQPTE